MKKSLILFVSFAFAAVASAAENPLLADWTATGGVPPFNEIRLGDIVPAYEAALAEERAEIAAICDQPLAPNYLNTIRRMTLAGSKIDRIRMYLVNMRAANMSPELAEIGNIEAKLLASRELEIYANDRLFQRVAKVYARRDRLNPERGRVTDEIYRRFVLAGAKLGASERGRLREIKERLAVLSQRFLVNFNAECDEFKRKHGFAPSVFSSEIAKVDDRARRETIYRDYLAICRRGNEHDNVPVALEMLKLRQEWARLVGYRNYAEMALEQTMAKTPEKALEMMEKLYAKSRAAAEKLRGELERLAGGKLEPWDWAYYTAKFRQSKVRFDVEDFRQYLPWDRVFSACFAAAERMYGIRAERVKDAPSFAPGSTETYRFLDADGSLLGTLIIDYHPRAGKHVGAWIEEYVYQYRDAEGREIRPVASQAGSFSKDHLTLANVRTVFHEFGHALQMMCSQCEDATLSGINATPDYTEVFSQFNQEIGIDPSYLTEFAANDKGEKPSAELIERAVESLNFAQGVNVGARIGTAILDLKLHQLTDFEGLDLEEFQRQVSKEIGLLPQQRLAYGIPTMRHVFVHEYASVFFSYTWSRVLSEDLLNEFRKKRDLTNPQLAFKFRRTFLDRGFSRDPMANFREFMRREPVIDPYLKAVGLVSDSGPVKSEGDEPGEDNFGVYDYVKGAAGVTNEPPADARFRDSSVPIEERIDDVLKYMTPMEKMQVLHMTSAASAGDIPRLGLPNFRIYDGPNGVRCDHPITYFPSCIAYAASFDRQLAFDVGRAMGAETRATVDERTGEVTRCLLGPGCNIARSPTGARSFEYFGEDPLLSGETAAAFCSGLQSVKVAPALKHYVLNDQEYCRTCINVSCGERALREIYERPFEIACRKCDVWTIMNSYNQVNGKWTSHAGTVNDDLRETGWTGAYMPDWGGTHGFTAAINGGTSFQSGCRKDPERDRELLRDLAEGRLDRARFEAALRETLRFYFRVGAFDAGSPEDEALQWQCKRLYRSEEHRQLAYRAAAESMVMLKNGDQFLPLERDKVRKVCVLGPNADFHHTMIHGKDLRQCGGSGAIFAGREPTPLEVARQIFGAENVSTKLQDARTADVVFYFGGFNHYTDREVLGNGCLSVADRADIKLDHQQLVELQQIASCTKRTVVALTTGAPVQCDPWIDKVSAVFVNWYSGEEGPAVFYDAVFGKVNPSGKLPFTFGYRLSDWYCHRLGERTFPGVMIPMTDEGIVCEEEYSDGIWVGYRGFDRLGVKPQFPFGFGLSYTDFEVSDPRPGDQPGSMYVTVANVGECAGRCVVQLYVTKPSEQGVEMPAKELVDFGSVLLEPGVVKVVELKYGFDELKFWDEQRHAWRLADGEYRYFIGQHSADRAVEGVLDVSHLRK